MANWNIGCSGFHYKHWKGIFYPEGLAQKIGLITAKAAISKTPTAKADSVKKAKRVKKAIRKKAKM